MPVWHLQKKSNTSLGSETREKQTRHIAYKSIHKYVTCIIIYHITYICVYMHTHIYVYIHSAYIYIHISSHKNIAISVVTAAHLFVQLTVHAALAAMGEERRGGIVATLHVLGGMRCPPEMINQTTCEHRKREQFLCENNEDVKHCTANFGSASDHHAKNESCLTYS